MVRRIVLFGLMIACGARSELRTVSSDPKEAGPPPDIAPDFAWYKLDETSDSVAHDSGPSHRDIWLDGVTWDDGALFDGASVCGATSVPEDFRTPPLTISAWLTPYVRDDATSNSYALTPFPRDAISGDYPAAGGYGLGLDVWTDGGGGHAVAVETGAGLPSPSIRSTAPSPRASDTSSRW